MQIILYMEMDMSQIELFELLGIHHKIYILMIFYLV